MVGTEGRQPARGSQSQKPDRSPDCRLQLACMKSESLVIADQHVAVNTFPGLVHTARHTMGVGFTRRSEEHTSELQSLMRNSYAVFCLKQAAITRRSSSERNVEQRISTHCTPN